MKRYLLITFLAYSGVSFAADCGKFNTTFEVDQCLANSLKSQKSDLTKLYKKLYDQSQAKIELENSQKAWLNYRNLQCGDYVLKETEGSPAAQSIDLSCQNDLIRQRIDFLKTLLR